MNGEDRKIQRHLTIIGSWSGEVCLSSEVDRIEAELFRLRDKLRDFVNDDTAKQVALWWTAEDVKNLAMEEGLYKAPLTAFELEDVVQRIKNDYDPEIGVNTDLVRGYLQDAANEKNELSRQERLDMGRE